jgi:hypothetical protein
MLQAQCAEVVVEQCSVIAINGRYRLAAVPTSGNRVNTVYRHVSEAFVIVRGAQSLLSGEDDSAVRWSLLDGDMVRLHALDPTM